MNPIRYVDLRVNTRPDARQTERAYSFVELQDAQRVKAEMALGIQQCVYENGVKFLESQGPIYGTPSILSSSVLRMKITDIYDQQLVLNFKTAEKKKPVPKDPKQAKMPQYNVGSVLQVEIMSDLAISASPLGRRLSEFFRPFEGRRFIHYRQEELEVLGRALGGIEPVFELQRRFDITPTMALAALDSGTALDTLVQELLGKKKK
ncbi:hypothetical protein HYX13_02840 [Candidatus Woesearchaeota archaeon]|nr:hypothetical protein [Candidatus Woesearchaeota archaeon]